MKLTLHAVAGLTRTKLQQSPRCRPPLTRCKCNHLLEWSITCPNFLARLSRDLQSSIRELAKDKVPFNWGPEHQSAFIQMKTRDCKHSHIDLLQSKEANWSCKLMPSIKALGACLYCKKKNQLTLPATL